ncbi:MAG: hypothetical protein KTR33_16260 [Gammaproteobacteria bacterium]|nr:hypothetical protein [Gammaproteobacteria bacterium]
MDPTVPISAGVSGEAVAGTTTTTVQAGNSPTISSDVATFTDSLKTAEANNTESAEAVAKAVLEPLDHLDQEADELIEYAQNAINSGNELTPSEIVMLTAKSQEFMFHSQLTANIANRSADGLQQLFRQQS